MHTTRSAPPTSIFTHGKHPVHQVSALYTENREVMVQRPWALAWETTVITANCLTFGTPPRVRSRFGLSDGSLSKL